MTTTSWDIVSGAQLRIDSVPSSIGSAVIEEYAVDAIREVEEFTGNAVGSTNIPTKYISALKNLTALYTLSRMTGIGADMDFTIGRISVSRGASSDPNAKQMAFLTERVNHNLSMIGRKAPFTTTEKVV